MAAKPLTLAADELRRLAAEGAERVRPSAIAWPDPIDLERLAETEPQPPKFIVRDWLPVGYASLLAGHGGVGKSGIALHLGVCIASGEPFFGLEASRRRVLYISAEDRENVLHWRLSRISAYRGIDIAGLRGWLDIVDLVGHNAVLWERNPQTGDTAAPAFDRLAERLRASESQLLIVDGISDTFAGNENARADVKRFVNALVSLIPSDGAVLLVGHIAKPQAASAATSEGYSGSTGWHNSVRARWYLYPETAQGEDGGRPERTGDLFLELQKSNLGRSDQSMRFRWDDEAHLFVGELVGHSTFDRKHQERVEQDGVRRAVRGCQEAGLHVPAALQGPSTAFLTLSQRPEFPESLKGGGRAKTLRFRRVLEQLRQLRHIEESSYRRSNRHTVATLVLTTEGRAECA
ncbi:MAG TPA: AAA family ATPase [Burkholderiales bacterium]